MSLKDDKNKFCIRHADWGDALEISTFYERVKMLYGRNPMDSDELIKIVDRFLYNNGACLDIRNVNFFIKNSEERNNEPFTDPKVLLEELDGWFKKITDFLSEPAVLKNSHTVQSELKFFLGFIDTDALFKSIKRELIKEPSAKREVAKFLK
jgi:hypothetical protein